MTPWISLSLTLAMLSCGPAALDRAPATDAGHRAECDDGNVISGDGCSSGGVVEDGYACRPAMPLAACRLVVAK